MSTAAALRTPGVYHQVVDASARRIRGIRTDVAGFLGIAERGPLHTPTPIESWRQFRAHFGGLIGSGYLGYSVRAFFENGGQKCWVVRVASTKATGGARAAFADAPQPGSAPGPTVWRVHASSPGTWGDRLEVRLVPSRPAQAFGRFVEADARFIEVDATRGFERGALVRLTLESGARVLRVLSDVDPVERRLVWHHERPALRLPYDRLLLGSVSGSTAMVESVEYALTVREEGRAVAHYRGLSLIPEHARYGPRILPLATELGADRTGLPSAPHPVALEERRHEFLRVVEGRAPAESVTVEHEHVLERPVRLTLADGSDGLRILEPTDFLGSYEGAASVALVSPPPLRGLAALGTVNEVSIVAIPDIHIQPLAPPERVDPQICIPDPCLPSPPAPIAHTPRAPVAELPPIFNESQVYRVQAHLVQHCEEMKDRVAILDPPFRAASDGMLGIAEVQAWRSRFDSSFAALYHPWIRVLNPLSGQDEITRPIPPSGHVAGQIAKTDNDTGVHRAAANAPLQWAEDVTVWLNDAEHGLLNTAGVNVVRPMRARGLRILGARTTSSDTSWRFLSVRRLMLMVMEAIDLSTQWAVFEPNDHRTRDKLRLSLISYLATLWDQGAFAGDTLESSFFVKCDEENNPPAGREAGRMVADIGIAPTQPFEFVVVRVWRAGNELGFVESAPLTGRPA